MPAQFSRSSEGFGSEKGSRFISGEGSRREPRRLSESDEWAALPPPPLADTLDLPVFHFDPSWDPMTFYDTAAQIERMSW